MPEFTFDPATGSGVETRGGLPVEQQGPSLQEAADAVNARSHSATAQHLAERAQQKAGRDTTQVGGSHDLAAEMKLQSIQKELYELNNGQRPSDPLRMAQLEQQQVQLAELLVGGTGEDVQESQPAKEWGVEDLKADLETELSNDPKIQETINWASQEFEPEVVTQFNEFLDDATKPESVQGLVNTLSELKKDPDSYSTSTTEIAEVPETTLQWFATEYSSEIADQVNTIATAVRTGTVDRASAMKTVMKSPQLFRAMMDAAHNGEVDFKLAL